MVVVVVVVVVVVLTAPMSFKPSSLAILHIAMHYSDAQFNPNVRFLQEAVDMNAQMRNILNRGS